MCFLYAPPTPVFPCVQKRNEYLFCLNVFFVHSAAIKINCCGFCGVTNKVNDTSWNVEEQYFNSTISVADKGMLLMLLKS